jgi:hypothetical protein
MTAQHIQTKQDASYMTKIKIGILGLIVLPIALAAYSNSGTSVSDIPSVLTSGVFPLGFTLLSWGLAVKLGLKLRK